MKNLKLTKACFVSLCFFFAIIGCNKKPKIVKEDWVEKPQSEWPDFALTNTISFTDTTFTEIANSFLVNTGTDTVGVSCKHLFMVFENHLGLKTINLGDDFIYWSLYPKNNPDQVVSIKKLVNTNTDEHIGQFNTLKVRDWIIFEIDDNDASIYPLKIRHSPVNKNEVLYALGWGSKQIDNSKPVIQKLQCLDDLGDYYYMTNLSPNIRPNGRSGSPVIDKNGYLVGIISGAEGKLVVIGSVNYLLKAFNKYGVEYKQPNS